MAAKMTIGEIAAQTGLRASAIRYYESIGLLPSPGRQNGWRRYDASIVQQISFIKTAQNLGFSIEEIKSLLDTDTSDQSFAKQLKMLAQRKITELEMLITQAQRMQRCLQAGLSCECRYAEDCSLFLPNHQGDTVSNCA